MREIPLTKGLKAIVDDEDFEQLNQWRWRADGRYASRYIGVVSGKETSIFMHREIMSLPPGREVFVDHINGDGRDNRRSNLRVATQSQNQFNRALGKNNTSGHKGIRWEEGRKRWAVAFQAHGKAIKVGRFRCLEEAKSAYEAALRKEHGEFARIA